LKQAQMEFSRNRISTVHSFCYRLLNDYAWEAGIEPRAPILDERRQASARDTAMRNVLLRADLASEPALAAALERLGTAMPLGELRATLEKLLRERNVAEAALRKADERWADPDAEIQTRATRHAALLGEALAPVLTAISRIDFGAVSAAADGDTLREPVLALRPQLEQPDGKELARLLLTQAGSARKPGGAKAKWKHGPDALEATREAWAEAANAMVDVGDSVPLHFDEAFERRAGGVLRDLWAIYQRVYAEYAEACAGGLDFLDLELRTIRLLHERADVRDELTRRLRFVLVDEFQDTNPTQGELFRLLTEGDDTPGRFFAVGDAKQSIYGFRGSDVSIFNRALADVPARNKRTGAAAKALAPAWGLRCDDSAQQRGGVIRLAHNYRTAAPVLELGNRIFRNIFATDAPRPYDAQAQDMIAGSDAPAVAKAVEFHLLPKPKRAPGEDDEGRARKDDEAELVARRVGELHAAGTAYKDIAILVRRGTRNWEYRNAFARHNLPLLVVGESGLFETQEGLDCLNLLRALANPFDDIAMLGLLRSPFAGLSDRYLTELALRHPRHLTLLERLRADQSQTPPETAAFLARFDTWRARAGKEMPALLLNAALAATGYALAARAKNAYLLGQNNG
jgi:ATP-dependent helicase/nuclease subunit A